MRRASHMPQPSHLPVTKLPVQPGFLFNQFTSAIVPFLFIPLMHIRCKWYPMGVFLAGGTIELANTWSVSG
jgi:hypothetical protein